MGNEGPYKHSTKGGKCVASCIACVYEEGRKAERERCLAIIERWRPMTKQTWVTVSDEIGGQDAK